MKKIVITAVVVLLAIVFAIASKTMLPSDINVGDFDSVFIRVLGFEIIAAIYFLLLFSHNAIATIVFGRNSDIPNMQIGVRFGVCFGLIYLFGMQEVILESSPFSSWGVDYVIYQFFDGAGEAIAALLLCIIISAIVIDKRDNAKAASSMPGRDMVWAVLLIAIIFTAVRAIAYETGIIHSNAGQLPVPTYVWTGIFGVVLGVCFVLLYPFYSNRVNSSELSLFIMMLAIGLCWIFFNLYIGLIFAGAMTEVLFRGGLDVIAMVLAVFIWNNYIRSVSVFAEMD